MVKAIFVFLNNVLDLSFQILNKYKKDEAQERYDKVESNPSNEFINTFGMCESEDRSKDNTNTHTTECDNK